MPLTTILYHVHSTHIGNRHDKAGMWLIKVLNISYWQLQCTYDLSDTVGRCVFLSLLWIYKCHVGDDKSYIHKLNVYSPNFGKKILLFSHMEKNQYLIGLMFMSSRGIKLRPHIKSKAVLIKPGMTVEYKPIGSVSISVTKCDQLVNL